MDLTYVISELRSELESLDEAIGSLEKLADIRRRRSSGEINPTEVDGAPKPPFRPMRQAAGADGKAEG